MSSVINVRLNEKMTLRFVHLYRDQRLLWDKDHESYNNRTDRLMAYRKIADGMGVKGMGVPEVASKIKNIRSTYLQELKKVKESVQLRATHSGVEDSQVTYVPKLLWFPIINAMIGDEAMKRFYSPPSSADMTFTDFSEDVGSSEHVYLDVDCDNDNRVNDNSHDDSGPAPKRFFYEQKKRSSNELFSEYLATTLESLPPRMAVLAQKDLHDVLVKYKLMACDQAEIKTEIVD